jgi:hypothetical protein
MVSQNCPAALTVDLTASSEFELVESMGPMKPHLTLTLHPKPEEWIVEADWWTWLLHNRQNSADQEI